MATKGYFLQDSSTTAITNSVFSSTTGIDGKSVAQTNIYTVPTGSGQRCHQTWD